MIGTSTSGKLSYDNERLVPYALDMADADSIAALADRLHQQGERLDVLINNAGVALDSHTVGVDMGKVRRTFEINLFGVLELTEKIFPIVVDGGHIINMDSRYGSFDMPIDDETSIGYRMSKASLNMYTRFLAFRLKGRGTKVSSFHPGWVKTDMGYAGVTDDGETPDREPAEVAKEIFELAVSDVESGQFWHRGKKTAW